MRPAASNLRRHGNPPPQPAPQMTSEQAALVPDSSPEVVTDGLVLLPEDTLGEVLRCPNLLEHPLRAT